MRRRFALTAVVVMAVIGTAMPAAAAPADDPVQGVVAPMAGPFRMKNWATGTCLISWAAGAVAGMLPCNSDGNQYWYWNQQADGWWEIKNLSTNACLEQNSADQVFTNGCRGSQTQKWQRLTDGHIRPNGRFGALDTNGDRVYMHSWNDGNYQKWDLLVF